MSKSMLIERLVGQTSIYGQSILTLAKRYAGFQSIWTSPIIPYRQPKLAYGEVSNGRSHQGVLDILNLDFILLL